MRLSVIEDPSLCDIEVDIQCPRIDRRVKRIIDAAEAEDRKISGISKGYLRIVDIDDVLYVEVVDGKTFLYTKDEVVESSLSLLNIESDLVDTEFIKATRQMLVNLAHVQGLKPYLNARLELMLDNGEVVIASRQFSPEIKKRIGL